MSDNVNIKDFAGSSVTVLADELTDATLGTGKVQFVKFMDGTVDSTNKLTIDSTGALFQKEIPGAAAESAPDNETSTAYEASHVAKPTSGTLYSIVGYNASTSDQFIQIHDASSLPADGAIPKVIFRVGATSNFSYSADKFGRYFANGIVVCNSTLATTKLIGGANCWFDIGFK